MHWDGQWSSQHQSEAAQKGNCLVLPNQNISHLAPSPFWSRPLNVSAPQSTSGNGTQARQRMNTPPRKKELEGELLPGGGVATCPRTRSRSSRSGCTTIGTTRIQATPKSWLWQRRPASLCCRSVSKMSLYCTLLLLFRHMQCLATDPGGWLQLEK